MGLKLPMILILCAVFRYINRIVQQAGIASLYIAVGVIRSGDASVTALWIE